MLSQAQRITILELNTQGVSKREIARVLGISRVAVRKVLRSNSTALPEVHRTEKAEPYTAIAAVVPLDFREGL
jgi:DNA invertase Pin-like site-specific DNA recombinase